MTDKIKRVACDGGTIHDNDIDSGVEIHIKQFSHISPEAVDHWDLSLQLQSSLHAAHAYWLNLKILLKSPR